MPRIYKGDIAKAQLETAVVVFLRGLDYSSVITLAGAASGILDTLVRRAGKEPFVDYARRVQAGLHGRTPKRQSYWHHIEKTLGVTVHKHLSEKDPETVELDLEELAADSLKRAISDYISLHGQQEPFVRAFLAWCWKTMDGAAMMERYKAVPKHMRPRG